MAGQVFISYSRVDDAVMRRIVGHLRKQGITVWVDNEKLVPGTPVWEEEIEKAIKRASAIIVVLSPEAAKSEWVRREITYADEYQKRIFPVLIRGDEKDSIPLRLSTYQHIDFRKNFNFGLNYLAKTLKFFFGGKNLEKLSNQKNKTPRINLRKLFRPTVLVVFVGVIIVSGLFTVWELAKTKDKPTGKIIYTCEIQGDEICIINADGSGWRRLTNTQLASFNASLSPDGHKAVYIVSDGKKSEIHEIDIDTLMSTQLTNLGKLLGSPEISPNNQFIVFHYRSDNNSVQLWVMNRDGSNPHKVYSEEDLDAHDPTWSPDGTQILFALGFSEKNKLYVIDFISLQAQLLNETINTRGRSDWAINNLISLDMGDAFTHGVFVMNTDGSGLRQVSPIRMNAQGASLSPDGKWVAFTAYTDVENKDINSCEIFIIRMDGTNLHRLTDNNYCDFQPRWGN